jgi:peptidyl-prolyl cis-trans isomerase D
MPLAQVRDAVVAAIHADRQQKAAHAAAEALVKAAQAKGLDVAARESGLAVSEINDLDRRSQAPSPEAVAAFFNLPRARGGVLPVGMTRAGGGYLVFAVRAVRDGDLTQITPQIRAKQRKEASDMTGQFAQDAFVRAMRGNYKIEVAEDRL